MKIAYLKRKRLPYTISFSGCPNGALPGPWATNSAWAISSGTAVGTPTTSTDIVTNGNMETNGTWTVSANPPISQAQSNEQAHGGTYSWKVVGAVAGESGFLQIPTWVASTWYQLSGWIYKTAGSYAYYSATPFPIKTVTGNNSWLQLVLAGCATATNHQLLCLASTGGTAYFDDITIKPLSLPTLVVLANFGWANITANGLCTITSGTQGGVAIGVDSPTSPLYGLFAYHNGTNAILSKLVNGTWTPNIINTAATYGAGKSVKIVKSGSSVSLYYGTEGSESQIGTTQTISDVGNYYYAGLFSTYSGNSFSKFSVART